MSKVIGKRILPGGNVFIKPEPQKEVREIPETPEYKFKEPEITIFTKPIFFPEEPTDIPFIVLERTKKLNSERVLVPGSGIKLIDKGPNDDLIILVDENKIDINLETSFFGGGSQIVLGTSGKEIKYRTLVGGGIIEVQQLSNTIKISATQNITISSFGGGISLGLNVSSNREIQLRTLAGGGIVEVSAVSDGRIIVSAPQYTQNITLSSFGNGEQIGIGVSGNREIHLRTLVGSGIVETSTSGNVIQISAARSTIEISSLGGVSLGLNVSAGTGNRNELRIRGLVGGGIIEVSALSDVVSISASPYSIPISDRILGYGSSNAVIVSAPLSSITFLTQSAIRMIITDDGNVGIGITNPQDVLEIFTPNDKNSVIRILNSATGTSSLAGSIIGLLSGQTDLTIRNRSQSNIRFDISNDNRFSIGYDKFSFKGNYFFSEGDVEVAKYILNGITSADNQGIYKNLHLPGSSRIVIPPNTSCAFEIIVLGKERNGINCGAYKYRGIITRQGVSADSVDFASLPFEEIISETSGAQAWEATLSANKQYGSLEIKVLISSHSGNDVYWSSYVNIIQVSV
ncbi:MAG: hypothetical protein QXF12_06985 [Candidatus Aenigmatarchaeota archaeon]